MRRQSLPLLVATDQGAPATTLKRVGFHEVGLGSYDEYWVQSLIHENPLVLPIASIEPNFWPAKSVCIELSLRSGSLDNLLVTPSGNVIAAECKLWRNPESLRKVLAQVLDYAKDLQAMSYPDFEEAIRKARKEPSFDLYDFASLNEADPPDRAPFVDAVNRNLRLGRCLLVIVGDGITDNLEAMTNFLQQHAGLHFGLTLVELAVYDVPSTTQRFIVPSIPMTTTNIVRGIVEIRDGLPVVLAPLPTARATSLTEEEFFAALDQLRPKTSERLRAFLENLIDLQISWEVKKTLIVRMTVGQHRVTPLVINSNGRIDMGYTAGQNDLLRPFTQKLVEVIPTLILRETPKTIYAKRKDNSVFTIWDLLDNPAGCRAALEELNKTLREASGEE